MPTHRHTNTHYEEPRFLNELIVKKRDNVAVRHVHESLLPWKSNKYYTFVCARAGGCVKARLCM